MAMKRGMNGRWTLDNLHVLYASGINGTREYRIWSEDAVIKILANGVKYEETVTEGKVNRTIDEQVTLRILSRVGKKLDNGFVYDKPDLTEDLKNQLGFYQPMKAQRLDKQTNPPTGKVYVQPKLEGHRCMLNHEMAYTKQGKALDSCGTLFDAIPTHEDVTLDGELYHHGTKLQTIGSWVKRYQPNTEKLKFMIFDCIIHDDLDAPFKERLAYLEQLQLNTERSKLVPSALMHMSKVNDYFKKCREKGLEGTMVRLPHSKYDIGKRSKNILKIKHYEEEEFVCVGMHCNRLGWAILELEAANGKIFHATGPGTVPVKKQTWKDNLDHIGNSVIIQFAFYTDEGVPFQPVATEWFSVL